jgi:hypothetical protein
VEHKEIFEQRRLVRQKVEEQDADLMRLHELAAEALEKNEAQEVRACALLQVDKWERGELCSDNYIFAWRRILNLPCTALRKAMLHDDAEGIALRRNTPFGFLLKCL